MQLVEFSDQFDVYFNNITSNQAPGLTEYEKSLFLTKAEKEIVKNYFTANSKGNTIGQGFDDSAKRQADFSILMKTDSCTPISSGTTTRTKYHCTAVKDGQTASIDSYDIVINKQSGAPDYTLGTSYTVDYVSNADVFQISGYMYGVANYPYDHSEYTNRTITITEETVSTSDKIDDRSKLYTFPPDVFIAINEAVWVNDTRKQVIPLRYDEYTRLMSKPFKRPVKNQVWRLMNSGNIDSNGHDSTKIVELIFGPEVGAGDSPTYRIRYVRTPKPIIVGNIDDLTIDGYSASQITACEIDPILHEDILQRAVELAKAAWTATGQDNTNVMLQTGQRSE